MSILEGQVYESQAPYRLFYSGLNEIWLQNEKLPGRGQKQDGRQKKHTNDTCFKGFWGQ